MSDYIWIINDAGEEERVSYDDLDAELYTQLFKPLGGFCYRADDFLRLKLPSIPYFIKGWLPRQGKAMLYASAKSGKSFLTYQMARCIAQGEEFLGIPTTKGKVLIVQFELGEKVLQERIINTRRNYDGVYIGTTFSMKLDTVRGKAMLDHALELVKPDVLILDPLYKVIKGDENEAHDMGIVCDFLDELIEKHKVSIFIMHHPGKDISKGGRGSSIMEGWVDSYLEMRKLSKNNEALRVRITPKLLRHSELPDKPLEAEMRDFEFTCVEFVKTVRDKVTEVIKAQGVTTPNDLMKQKIGSRKSITNALEDLITEGVVFQPARGQYQWKGGGKARVIVEEMGARKVEIASSDSLWDDEEVVDDMT